MKPADSMTNMELLFKPTKLDPPAPSKPPLPPMEKAMRVIAPHEFRNLLQCLCRDHGDLEAKRLAQFKAEAAAELTPPPC